MHWNAKTPAQSSVFITISLLLTFTLCAVYPLFLKLTKIAFFTARSKVQASNIGVVNSRSALLKAKLTVAFS